MNGFTPNDAAQLIEKHRQELFSLLVRRVACPDAANDLLQDIFIRLIHCHPSEPVNNVRAFMYRIADNIAIDYLRRHKQVLVDLPDSDADEEIVDQAPLPEQTIFGQQQLDQFEQALNKVSPLCRKIFVLSRFEGYSHPRIAEELNISISWVEKNIIIALKQLKQAVDQS